MALTVITLDVFSGSFSAINGRAPDTTNIPGTLWVAQAGTFHASSTASPFVSQFCGPNSQANGDNATYDCTHSDFTLTCDVSRSIGPLSAWGAPNLMFRWSDSSNYWRTNFGASNPVNNDWSIANDLIKVVAGNPTTVANSATLGIAKDSKGGNNLTYSATTNSGNAWIPIIGQSNGNGNGITFDKNTPNFATATTSGLPTGAGAGSMECWFKSTNTSNQGLMAYGTTNVHDRLIETFSSGTKIGFFSQDATPQELSFTATVTDGNWHHVVADFDGTTRTLYLDGTSLGSDTPTGINTTTTPVFLGSYSASLEHFNGSLSSCAIYNTALGATKVAAHYAARVAGTNTYDAVILAESSLVAYWELNDQASILRNGASAGFLYNQKIVASGNTITGYLTINGVDYLQWTDTGGFNSTATVVGIHYGVSATPNSGPIGWDNFQVQAQDASTLEWYHQASEPVRGRQSLVQSLYYTTALYLPEIVTVDKWFRQASEPVRAAAPLRQSLYTANVFPYEVVTVDRWFHQQPDPVQITNTPRPLRLQFPYIVQSLQPALSPVNVFGFETGDLLEAASSTQSASGAISAVTTYSKIGAYSCKTKTTSSLSSNAFFSVGSLGTNGATTTADMGLTAFFLRFHFLFITNTTTTQVKIVSAVTTATLDNPIQLALNNINQLVVTDLNGGVHTGASILIAADWYRIDLTYLQSGHWDLRINGAVELSGTITSGEVVDQCLIGIQGSLAVSEYYFDNVWLDQGVTPPEGGMVNLVATGVGFYTQWSGATSPAVPPPGDLSAITTTTLNDTRTVTTSGQVPPNSVINIAKPISYIKRNALIGTSGQTVTRLRSGTVDVDTTVNYSATVNYTPVENLLLTDPATGNIKPWSVATINAAQPGVKCVQAPSGVNTLFCESIYLMVDMNGQEGTSPDKWFTQPSEPVWVPRRPVIVGGMVAQIDPNNFGEVITVDKWFSRLSEPVRERPALRQSIYMTPPVEPTLFTASNDLRWFTQASEPVRQRARPVLEGGQFSQIDTATAAGVFYPDKWFHQQPDPVRQRPSPVNTGGMFEQIDPTSFVVTTDIRWFRQPSIPTRPRATYFLGVGDFSFVANPGDLPPNEVITVDKYFTQPSEPVRLKPSLRQSTWIAPPVEPSVVPPVPSMGWYVQTSIPVLIEKPRQQFTITYFLANPPDATPVSWQVQQPDPVRARPPLILGINGDTSPFIDNEEVVFVDKWYKQPSEPLRGPPRCREFLAAANRLIPVLPNDNPTVRLIIEQPEIPRRRIPFTPGLYSVNVVEPSLFITPPQQPFHSPPVIPVPRLAIRQPLVNPQPLEPTLLIPPLQRVDWLFQPPGPQLRPERRPQGYFSQPLEPRLGFQLVQPTTPALPIRLVDRRPEGLYVEPLKPLVVVTTISWFTQPSEPVRQRPALRQSIYTTPPEEPSLFVVPPLGVDKEPRDPVLGLPRFRGYTVYVIPPLSGTGHTPPDPPGQVKKRRISGPPELAPRRRLPTPTGLYVEPFPVDVPALDHWFVQASEPVRARPVPVRTGIIAEQINPSFFPVAPTVSSWMVAPTQPYPVRLRPVPEGQTVLVLPPTTVPPPPLSSTWYVQPSEPVLERSRIVPQRLGWFAYPWAATQAVVPPTDISWFVQASEPVRQRPRATPEMASPLSPSSWPTITVAMWQPCLTILSVTRRGVLDSGAKILLDPDLFVPPVLTGIGWFIQPSEPVRTRETTRLPWFTQPLEPSLYLVPFVSSWYQQASEPVKVGPERCPALGFVVYQPTPATLPTHGPYRGEAFEVFQGIRVQQVFFGGAVQGQVLPMQMD